MKHAASDSDLAAMELAARLHEQQRTLQQETGLTSSQQSVKFVIIVLSHFSFLFAFHIE